MFDPQSRREFLRRAMAAGVGTAAATSLSFSSARAQEPAAGGDKLNIGVVGVAARGSANLAGVASQNIVALCDIDAQRLGGAAERFPGATLYTDYRKLVDHKGLDAVVVSTPDHTHAIPAVWAMKRGLHVYCEKPLAHSVWEVRQMREAAAKNKVATQMGTQIHAGDNYRRAVEIVQGGVIGKVARVHVWQGNSVPPGKRVAEGTPPSHVDYDLWLGPAPERPFHESHFHFNWRYWWDFGGGVLGDMGCHFIDLPFWALGLRYPTSVEAKGEKTYQGDNEVPNKMQVDWHFPAREDQPEVHLTWYHGGWMPEGAEEYQKGSAVLFEGERGRLLADYGSRKVYMEGDEESKMPEPTIPASIGHYEEWIEACKTGSPTTCNFDYSGALAEAVLLGNVAYRAGEPLEWDAEKLEATNSKKAAEFVRREYRKGWSLEG